MMFGKRSTAITLTPLTSDDRHRLEALCTECREFFELVQGHFAHAETAEEILGPLPETMHACCSKVVYGLEREGNLIGVAELLEGYPHPSEWYVGLLLLKPGSRRGGTGTAIWKQLRQRVEATGARVVRLVVQKENEPAKVFWERQGFVLEDEGLADHPPAHVWRLALTL